MAAPNKPPEDSDLSLPKVQVETIESLSQEVAGVQQLYERSFEDDETVALFIRRRASELAPDDLGRREDIATVALEVIEVERRQTVINGLNRRWFQLKPVVKPLKPGTAETKLPPAA